MKSFSITQAISYAINKYFKNIALFIPLTIMPSMLILAILWLSSLTSYCIDAQNTSSHAKLCIIDLLQILLVIYRPFMINFCLKIDQSGLKPSDFLKIDFDIFKYLIARLRYTLTCIIGFIAFIIPGLNWLTRYFFAHYFIIDQKLGVRKSFAESAQLTYGAKLKLLLFLALQGLCYALFSNIGQSLAFLLGLMIFLPLSVLAQVSIYKQLLTENHLPMLEKDSENNSG